jgi:hypothetical protein
MPTMVAPMPNAMRMMLAAIPPYWGGHDGSCGFSAAANRRIRDDQLTV